MGDAWKCPECKVASPVEKWPITDFHSDGTESLSCPLCGCEIHEEKIGQYRVIE